MELKKNCIKKSGTIFSISKICAWKTNINVNPVIVFPYRKNATNSKIAPTEMTSWIVRRKFAYPIKSFLANLANPNAFPFKTNAIRDMIAKTALMK